MSLLHKAITLSGACAIGLTLAFAAPAAADDAKPINFRAVGGAVLGGTWNVGLTGVGKLVNDRYPGSAINVLQGASVSNPLRLEQNAADVTLTQTFNTVAARDGKARTRNPSKCGFARQHERHSRLSIIVSADLPVNTFDELMEKLPVRLDRGAGTLHNVVGAMLLAEYGYTYDDITKWGGAHTAVSANDRVGMFQDGTLNAYLTLGPGQQSHIQELVLNAKVKWLPVSDKVLKSVTAKTGQSIGVIPADFYGGAVGRDIPCITDSTVMLVRKNMPDADVYKITKAIVEGFEELHAVQPTWKTLVPEHMADNLALPLHPGAEKYYREAGIIK
ncbi:MAG: TAXI family TRAP transporter solute-binding subunit [Bilophila wadsworthia]